MCAALYTAARLGVADVLQQQGPLPAAELASRLDVKEDALARVLRCLTAHGVFAEVCGWLAGCASCGCADEAACCERCTGSSSEAEHRCSCLHGTPGTCLQTSPGTFANNRGSSVLRADHPTSMRNMLLTWGDESYWAHEKLAESLQAGSPPAFQLQSGGIPYFDWLQQPGNEGRSQAFHSAMIEAARALTNVATLEVGAGSAP